jgi:hypothetical protein
MDLAEVKPTTIGGAVALLRYVSQVSTGDPWSWPQDFANPEGQWFVLLTGNLADALATLEAAS